MTVPPDQAFTANTEWHLVSQESTSTSPIASTVTYNLEIGKETTDLHRNCMSNNFKISIPRSPQKVTFPTTPSSTIPIKHPHSPKPRSTTPSPSSSSPAQYQQTAAQPHPPKQPRTKRYPGKQDPVLIAVFACRVPPTSAMRRRCVVSVARRLVCSRRGRRGRLRSRSIGLLIRGFPR